MRSWRSSKARSTAASSTPIGSRGNSSWRRASPRSCLSGAWLIPERSIACRTSATRFLPTPCNWRRPWTGRPVDATTPVPAAPEMSGIVAIANVDGAPIDRAVLARLTDALSFRGPDRLAARAIANAGLGHTLLSLDEEGRGDQPFTLDGRTWVVADARIDARADLVAAMQAETTCAVDAPDVELIARAYERWGEDCAAHLLGDFAFVVWDAPRRRLFCARDQLGVKPLFYARLGDTVVVSNTLECVRRHPLISQDLHEPAIADFLLFGANQDAASTIWRDVHRVPAAHCVAWSMEATRLRRFWTVPVDEPVHYARAADYTDRFTELLRRAVRDRTRTRRAAVFMSGGIDSTTLAATALAVLRERPEDFFLQALTCVYDRLIPDAERRYAGLVAEHLRIPITYDVR